MKFTRYFSILLIAVASLLTFSASAAPLPAGMTAVPLATITNDRDTSISTVNLMINMQSNVSGIYLQTRDSADSSASDEQNTVYWLSSIESNHGVVLGQGQGHKAILLHGNIYSQHGHGSLVISYLHNGLFGSYNKCEINVQRTAPHEWQLVNTYNNQPVEHIKVQTWALGISTLTNVCPTA